LPIYHGTSDEVLAKGVGHLEGSSLPVGGTSQHSVLTAHRGLPSAELFNNLHKLTVGDTFTVEAFGEVLTYRATRTATILPDETQSLLPQQGEDLMTLVTCTPLGINSHRYLVTGERVSPTPIGDVQRAGSSPQIPGFPWWALALAAAIGGYAGVVIRSGKPKSTSNARARSRHRGAPRLLGYGASHMDDAFGPDDGDGDGEVSATARTQNYPPDIFLVRRPDGAVPHPRARVPRTRREDLYFQPIVGGDQPGLVLRTRGECVAA